MLAQGNHEKCCRQCRDNFKSPYVFLLSLGPDQTRKKSQLLAFCVLRHMHGMWKRVEEQGRGGRVVMKSATKKIEFNHSMRLRQIGREQPCVSRFPMTLTFCVRSMAQTMGCPSGEDDKFTRLHNEGIAIVWRNDAIAFENHMKNGLTSVRLCMIDGVVA